MNQLTTTEEKIGELQRKETIKAWLDWGYTIADNVAEELNNASDCYDYIQILQQANLLRDSYGRLSAQVKIHLQTHYGLTLYQISLIEQGQFYMFPTNKLGRGDVAIPRLIIGNKTTEVRK